MLRLKYPARALLLFALFASLLMGRAAHAQVAPPPFVPGRVLVKFQPGVTADRAQQLLAAAGGQSIRQIAPIGVHIVQLPAQASPVAVAKAFGQQREVAFAEPDYIHQPAAVPNDPLYSNQWQLPIISAPTAWDRTTGSSSVIIAILDTGVEGTHPDLAPKLVPGWNFYDNNADTSDVHGHGTATAGTAAACSNNGAGVASVAWGCLIMPVRIGDQYGNAYDSTIATGLIYAADHGARVANCSYAALSGDATVTSAAQYMQGKGGVFTVPAGNSGTFNSTPDNPYMLTVSATDSTDHLASFSTTGNCVDLAAPGNFIYCTALGGGYGWCSGTSFSAPIVAGVAALVLSVKPSLSSSQVQDVLKQSADDLGPAGWDPSFGWGRVNAARAVNYSLGITDTTPPTVSITTPAAGTAVMGTVTVQVNASDNVSVSSVNLSVVGAGSLGSDTLAPYSFTWDTTKRANGTQTLVATATDSSGNTTSAQISVTVNNPLPDTTPPTVSLTAPANGATVSGSTWVRASASDNVGVSSVDFYLDGVFYGNKTTSPYEYIWDTTTAANGAHTLKAVAKDAAGNSASAQISITVSNGSGGTGTGDSIAPTISITSPAAGSTMSGTVSVTVSAADNVGVVKVALYVDGKLTATSTNAPFTTKWSTRKAAAGAHTLQCKAYDAAGNVGTSAAITVYK